jgi:hypothetical protein
MPTLRSAQPSLELCPYVRAYAQRKFDRTDLAVVEPVPAQLEQVLNFELGTLPGVRHRQCDTSTEIWIGGAQTSFPGYMAQNRGGQLGLNEDEVAFYDALETNDSAVKVLGDDTLRTIARELVETVRKNTTIDWTIRENVRANLRVLVKRILRKYGYPPDKQERATLTVLEQAEVLSANWAVA